MNKDLRANADPSRQAAVGGACILDTIVDSFIIPVSVKESIMNSTLPLDSWRPEVYETNFNHCLGLLTIADFLNLVQSLYEIDPSTSERIRAIVQRLYSSEGFNKFFEVESIQDVKIKLDQVLTELYSLNKLLKQPDPSLMDEDFQQAMLTYTNFQRSQQNSIKRE